MTARGWGWPGPRAPSIHERLACSGDDRGSSDRKPGRERRTATVDDGGLEYRHDIARKETSADGERPP